MQKNDITKKTKLAKIPNGTSMTDSKKQAMIEALRKHRGLVRYAADAVGIYRTTHYVWLKKDPEYASAVANIKEFVLDEIEGVAHKMMIDDHNPAMTIFYLKCQGKNRGYVEKTEVEHTISNKFKETVEQAMLMHEKDY